MWKPNIFTRTNSYLTGLLILMVLNFAPACQAQSTVAIISGTGDRAVDPRYVARLEAGLSAKGTVQLVERERVHEILREQALSFSGVSDISQNTVQLGRLLSAGHILYVERVPQEQRLIYQLRIVDTRSGIVLSSWLVRDQISEADLEEVHRLLQRAVAKSHMDAESTRYVGILQFRSTGLGSTLDGFSELLEAYLTEALAKAPEVVVLEREQLRYLQREQDLTGLQLQLRTSALLLEGGVRYIDGQRRIRVELVFRRLGTSGQIQTRSIDLPADDQSHAANLEKITVAILEYLNVHPPVQSQTNRSQEAGLFLKQVPLLLASGRFEDAISKAEVALALRPDQDARFWTARAWYRQAESIRPNFDYSRRPAHMRSRIRRVTDAGVPSRRAPPPVDEDKNAQEAKLRGDLHRLLTSLIRAYSIGRDLTRWHINGTDLSVIPDPFGPQPMFDPNGSSRRKPRLVDMLQEQDTRGRQLFELLRQLSRDAIRQQKSYYEEHYRRSPEMADAYWQTWFRMKEFMFDYAAYDQVQIGTFTANVFKAFTGAADGDLETRLRGIKPLIQLQPGAMLAPADVALYSQLFTSPDPWTRFLAHRQMIREDFLKHSDAVLQIFQQDILPEGRIWDFTDANLVPAYLRTAIHRLAVSDPGQLIKYYAAVYKQLVQPAHMRHLIAWNNQDCFWPYLNVLAMHGNSADVGQLLSNIAALLDRNGLALSFDELRSANVLRLQLDLKMVQLGFKEQVDEHLWAYEAHVGAAELMRLRPELEAPTRAGPLDLSLFENWTGKPMRGSGLRMTTKSTSRDVFSKKGAGIASQEGHEHRIDSEGNETLRQFSQTVASEKAKTLDPASRAWQDYVIRPLPFRVAATGRPLRGSDPVAEPRDVVIQAQTISGNDIYVAQEARTGKKIRITAYEHDAVGGRDILRIGAAEIPAVEGQGVHITATAVDDQNFYVGTVNGLLIFKRGTGQPLPESDEYAALTGHMGTRLTGGIGLEKDPAENPGHVRYVNEASGLPDNRILSLAADGQYVYMGIGPLTDSPGVAGDCGFAVYQPADGTYEILATSRSRTGKNPLDAGKFYRIDKLLMAPDGESVWLAVNGQLELNGLWQFHIATKSFEHRVPEVFPVLDMHWSREDLLYSLWGSGIARYTPPTGRKEWLLGYVPSKFTPPAAPLPPVDVKTNPVYGFARTRLWPFAVSGGDLFTFGWEFQDVLIHRAGQPAAAKSIFDPDAGVIAGKSYLLSGPDDSVWLLQSDGGGFLVRRRD